VKAGSDERSWTTEPRILRRDVEESNKKSIGGQHGIQAECDPGVGQDGQFWKLFAIPVNGITVVGVVFRTFSVNGRWPIEAD
jgi:hypothetical protein